MQPMRLEKHLFLILFLVAAHSCTKEPRHLSEKIEPRLPSIKFGLMQKDKEGNYQVYDATTVIPFVLDDPSFRFGATIESSDKSDHVARCSLSCSAPIRDAKFTEGNDYEPIEYSTNKSRTVFETEDRGYHSYWGMDFKFSKTDPLGKYELTIYVDDKLAKEIEFTVVHDK